ncbi:MAG: Na(+)/H(+) antiporter subunit D [Syntrophomonadaceae bacterium]|nr:Na(+)/H(+) antiporter subunit D [Bacillota bacterium]
MTEIELYLLFILISFVISPLLLFLTEKKRQSVLILLILLMVLLSFYNLSGARLREVSILHSLGNIGLAPLSFAAHPYAGIAVFGFLLVGALALLYGLQVATPAEQAVSLVAVSSAVGIGFAANFITLFLFWEMLTLSVAALVMLRMTPDAVYLGYRLLIFHLFGGLLLLTGIMQHHAVTGTFALAVPEAGLPFFVLAIAFKAAFLPIHVWLSWGYPTASFPASVVLAGLSTKVGVYAVARFLPSDPAIVLMGGSMAVFGIICALLQKDMRRFLSCSIISSVGYMVAGAGMGSYYGIDGSMAHLLNGMLYMALLFMSAGAVLHTAGTENLHDLTCHDTGKSPLAPVWKSLPVAAIGALTGALAISGIPPFNGYVSKYLLKKAISDANAAELLLMLASVGTVVSFCKFTYYGFYKGRTARHRDMTVTMKAAVLAAAALCLALGVWPQLISGLLPYSSKLAVYSAPGVIAALQLLGIGVVLFIALKSVLKKTVKASPWLSIESLFFQPLLDKILQSVTLAGRLLDSILEMAFVGLLGPLSRAAGAVGTLDGLLLPRFGRAIIAKASVIWDAGYALLRKKVQEAQLFIRQAELATFFTLIKLDYNPRGDQLYRKLTLMSLDLCIFLVVIILVIIISFRHLVVLSL